MYRKIERIALMGLDSGLVDAIASIEPPEGFTYDFTSLDTLDASLLPLNDLAIIDAAVLPHAPASLAPLKGNCRLVFCAPPHEVLHLTSDNYAALEDIWSTPLSSETFAFLFNKLIEQEKTRADLALNMQYLDTMIDSIPELIWFKDARGSHLKVNNAFCETVQKTKEQVEGRGHYYIWDITPEEYSTGEYVCMESEYTTMEARETCLFDEQVKTSDGMRQFKTYKSPLFDFDGSVMGTVGVAHDVTDLDNIKTELDIFINSMPYAVVVLDSKGVVVNVNNQAEKYFEVGRVEAVGNDFERLRRRVLSDVVVDSNDFANSSSFTARINGHEKTFVVNEQIISDVFGSPIGQLRIYRDITKERELERRVIRNANTDYLTGLYNRRYLYAYLENHTNESISLVYLDLDDFKGINDTYGHQAGDRVLIATSEVLSETFPHDVVTRMGGDEFVILVPGVQDHEELEARAQTCLDTLSKRLSADKTMRPSTGSMGIAYDDEAALTIDELIHRGDLALYEAKRAGKSQYQVWTSNLED